MKSIWKNKGLKNLRKKLNKHIIEFYNNATCLPCVERVSMGVFTIKALFVLLGKDVRPCPYKLLYSVYVEFFMLYSSLGKKRMVLGLFSFFFYISRGVMKIYYLCNRKRCVNCTGECNHTCDIRYSLNYRKRPTRRQKIQHFRRIDEYLLERGNNGEKRKAKAQKSDRQELLQSSQRD